MLLHFPMKNKHHTCTPIINSLPTSQFDLKPLKIITRIHFANENHRTLTANDNTGAV
ncbi:hypothetical protein [Endozoicomonas sp. YOMI1]|uniref:hypothetical protein n=1 Tax=Endozoicomonas sp. YOMI1 TaxID=2828739 RepID=UPI0021478BAD|nr:hypothetical protein [Endozoicomonas sp. YOMI1]